MIAKAIAARGLEVLKHGNATSGVFYADNGVDYQIVVLQVEDGYHILTSNNEEAEFFITLSAVLDFIKEQV